MSKVIVSGEIIQVFFFLMKLLLLLQSSCSSVEKATSEGQVPKIPTVCSLLNEGPADFWSTLCAVECGGEHLLVTVLLSRC